MQPVTCPTLMRLCCNATGAWTDSAGQQRLAVPPMLAGQHVAATTTKDQSHGMIMHYLSYLAYLPVQPVLQVHTTEISNMWVQSPPRLV
jgi:hypothetical protein